MREPCPFGRAHPRRRLPPVPSQICAMPLAARLARHRDRWVAGSRASGSTGCPTLLGPVGREAGRDRTAEARLRALAGAVLVHVRVDRMASAARRGSLLPTPAPRSANYASGQRTRHRTRCWQRWLPGCGLAALRGRICKWRPLAVRPPTCTARPVSTTAVNTLSGAKATPRERWRISSLRNLMRRCLAPNLHPSPPYPRSPVPGGAGVTMRPDRSADAPDRDVARVDRLQLDAAGASGRGVDTVATGVDTDVVDPARRRAEEDEVARLLAGHRDPPHDT